VNAPLSQVDAAAAPQALATPQLSPRHAWLIVGVGTLAICILYVFGTRAFPLSDPDESRYAEIAREMLVRHDWVTPNLNYVKYFEKPPLVYWGTALAFAGFGFDEFVARLPAMLSGLATIALTVWLAARMYGASTAVLALPILALGPLFGILSMVLTLDVSLALFTTLAMVSVWFAWSATSLPERTAAPGAGPRVWYRVAYVATALAILVKGPVAAVLVAAIALGFLLLHGGWRAIRPTLDWRGAVLALVVALPWFVLVSLRNPEFVHFFVVDQHIARYLWTHEHGEPIWFYLPLLPVSLAPWTLMPLFDPQLVRAALAPRTWAPATSFLVIWTAVIVVFFSLSTSKLGTYILPAMPPLALLTARAIEVGFARGRTAGLSRVAWFLLIAGPIVGLCGAVLPMVIDHWRMAIIATPLFAGGPVLMLTGWLVLRVLRSGRPYAALGVLAVGWCIALGVALTGRAAANEYRSLGVAAHDAMRPGDRLAMYNHYTAGIPYYSQHRTIMVGLVGELKFGSEHGADPAYFWQLDDLRREWAAPGRLFLVINRVELDAFKPPLDPAPIVLASKDEKVLLVNR
jgi:4-amino-4-deoxy-L-arabinose transferase-like glycosyltransferase